MKKIVYLFILFFLIFYSGQYLFSNSIDYYNDIAFLDLNDDFVYDKHFEQNVYKDSLYRRFDITFFLSFPVFVLYNFIFHHIFATYLDIRGSSGLISSHQIAHIGLSSILLAFGVAYSDYLYVSDINKKQLLSFYNLDKGFVFNFHWSFNF